MPTGYDRSTPQATYHPERKMHCKGLCKDCYRATRSDYNKDYQKTRHKRNPELKKRASLKGLGWTLELFHSIKDEQDNRCAICRKALNMDKKQNGARACADHEHSIPPKPRGVICTNCNAGIGQFQDNPIICEAAAVYLKAHKFKNNT